MPDRGKSIMLLFRSHRRLPTGELVVRDRLIRDQKAVPYYTFRHLICNEVSSNKYLY